MSTRLNIVVAHKLEAIPLLGWLDLHAVCRSPAIYGDNRSLRLIVSGEGCQASQDAVNFLAQDSSNSPGTAWLNIGIAGHQSKAIGEVLLVNKLVRPDDGATHYPVPLAGQVHGELHTVNEPELRFPEDVAYDMEAFGFFSAAKEFTTLELVQCLKIISDNAKEDASTVTRERVVDVMTNSKGEILQVIEDLLALQQHYQDFAGESDAMEELIARVHLTATQRSQLKRLLQRFRAFGLEQELPQLTNRPGINARQLIQSLRTRLQEVVE